MFKKVLSKSSAFTLVELLVVISIIGILAALGIISLSTVAQNGRDAKRIADLRTIQSVLDQFYADQGYYPGDINSILRNGDALTAPGDNTKVYLNQLPKDPSANSSYYYSAFNRNGQRCINSSRDCNTYCVYAQLENVENICDETNRYIPQGGNCPNITPNNALQCQSDSSKPSGVNFALTPP